MKNDLRRQIYYFFAKTSDIRELSIQGSLGSIRQKKPLHISKKRYFDPVNEDLIELDRFELQELLQWKL
jgi:hypothetical protein